MEVIFVMKNLNFEEEKAVADTGKAVADTDKAVADKVVAAVRTDRTAVGGRMDSRKMSLVVATVELLVEHQREPTLELRNFEPVTKFEKNDVHMMQNQRICIMPMRC